MDLLGQCRTDFREHLIDQIFGTYHGCVDATYDFFQKIYIPFFGSHDAFPVPLVDI